jgi:hypothetical protein
MGYSDPPSLNILTQDILFEKLPKPQLELLAHASGMLSPMVMDLEGWVISLRHR